MTKICKKQKSWVLNAVNEPKLYENEFKCKHNFLAVMVHDFIYFLGTFSIDTSETA